MMQRTRRLILTLGVLFFLGLTVLTGRVAWIALATHDEAAVRMDRQSLRAEVVEARRGSVFDRHGRVLASSCETLRVEVLPRNLHRRADGPEAQAELVAAVAGWLAPVVQAPVDDLVRRLSGERWSVLGEPVCDPEHLEALEGERRKLLYGLDLQGGWTRKYPWGATAGNLVGYVSHENVGVSGLEQGLDHLLSGHDGARRYRVDHLGREVVEAGHDWLAPVDGLDVTLTLDVRLQQIVEEEALASLDEFEASRVTVVAMEPGSGDVLAMCSVPGIDLSDGRDRGKNGSVCAAVQEVYPPGSTFKPLMMAAAIQLGLAHPDEAPVDCTAFEGRRIRDTHPQDHPLTLEEILVHSSNIGMAKLLTRLVPPEHGRDGERMRPVHDILLQLGLGRPTGVPLPAEAPGLMTPLEDWTRKYTLASVAFGQELGVSALQMAAAASVLVDGSYRRPRLVFACTSADGERALMPDPEPRRVFRRDIVDTVRGYMRKAVEAGSCEAVKLPEVAVAGKTGTAQFGEGLRKEIHSYTALVPAEDPYLTLVVVVREPQGVRFSSQSAAPTAGRILRRVLPYLGQPIQE